jgi:predicted outer membrane repeat protein
MNARTKMLLSMPLFIAAGAMSSLAQAGGTVSPCTEANFNAALVGGGTVNFNCGTATITITTTKTISANTVIDGGGVITLDAANSVRLFSVQPLFSLTLNNITLTRGAGGGGTGGAVDVSSGTLIADHATFTHNNAGAGGGAIYAIPCGVAGPGCPNPTVTVTNSVFTSNASTNPGGAICVASATLGVSDSTFTGNSSLYGGAMCIYPGSDAVLTRDTFSGNTSAGNNFSQGHGGAIAVEGANTLTISNSTFTGNQAQLNSDNSTTKGGAIFLFDPPASAILNNLTVAGNSASGSGGGIYFTLASTTIENSIVASNTNGNCASAAGFVNGGNNLQFGDATCTGFASGNPLLGALANNGGPTQSMALSAGSPAIDAGNNLTCTANDQRGFPRKDGDGNGTVICDIGAFEFDPAAAAIGIAVPTPALDRDLLALLVLALAGLGAMARRRSPR